MAGETVAINTCTGGLESRWIQKCVSVAVYHKMCSRTIYNAQSKDADIRQLKDNLEWEAASVDER